MNKKFEIGKAYQHNSGMQMFICGMGDTIYHGSCFIAEEGWDREKLKERYTNSSFGEMISTDIDRKGLTPVSMANDATENWFEISKEDFIKNNTTK